MCITFGACSKSQDWRGFSVIGPAASVHRLDQCGDALRRRRLRDAVAQIEHMAIAAPEAGEHGGGAFAHGLWPREQHLRIEVALQCSALADAPARFSHVDGPVQAY